MCLSVSNRKYEDHPNVLLSVQRGIPHARRCTHKIPKDVAEYIALKANKFHKGSSWTFLQQYDLVKPLEAKFVMYKAQLNDYHQVGCFLTILLESRTWGNS